MKSTLSIAFVLTLAIVAGCSSNYTPKPKGYFRIDFPVKSYRVYDSICPYTFEYPTYGFIVQDDDKNAEPCWFNIVFKGYKGKIHLSYKPVNKNIDKYIEDSHMLAYKHTIKADGIEEILVSDPKRKVYGLVYDIKGNTASSVQFFITDSTKHFLRGSLYFESIPNKDSLAPSISFFRKDILHLIETLKWKN
jgi:gliding motility-associated lipoprotein GldD